MYHVFISYSRRDFGQVQLLVDRLQDLGIEFWLDQTDIPVSVPWLDEIEDAIRAATVVCVCDSASWQSSENCAVEYQLATDHGKSVVRWNLGADDDLSAVRAITDAQAERDDPARLAADLLTSSFRWSKHGRSAAALAAGRRLRGFVWLSRSGGARLDRAARDYLQASIRRQRRRRTLAVAGVALTGIILLTISVAIGVRKEVEAGLQESTDHVAAAVSGDLTLEHNVYLGFAQALDATEQKPETFDSRQLLGQALAEVVPVRSQQGEPVTTHSVNSITARSARTGQVAVTSSTQPTVTVTDRRGRLVRRLAATGPATALSWSTNGRYLALASQDGATVYDTANAVIVWRLRGVPRAVVQLAWSDHDRAVFGTTADGLRVEWRLLQARLTSSIPDAWFMDLATQTTTPKMAAVSRDGRVFGFDAQTGKLEWSTSRQGEVSAALSRGPGGGWLAARLQDKATRLDLLSDSGALQHSMVIPGCAATDVDFSEKAQAAVLSCRGQLGVVVHLSGTWQARRADVPLVDTASVVAYDNTAVFGGGPGELMQLDLETLKTKVVARGMYSCLYSGQRLALTPNGTMLFNTGAGAANGCSFRFARQQKEWTRNTLMLPLTESADESRGLAISPDGKTVAIGFSDGTIRTVNIDQFTSHTLRHDRGGEIRGLAYTPDGKSLVAVTRDGDLAIYPTGNDQLTATQERSELRRRLTNAVAQGLYTPAR